MHFMNKDTLQIWNHKKKSETFSSIHAKSMTKLGEDTIYGFGNYGLWGVGHLKFPIIPQSVKFYRSKITNPY